MQSFRYGKNEAGTVLIQMVDAHDLRELEQEAALIQKDNDDFSLIALKVNDWNRDLSPWKAPAVYGDNGFNGMAEETLKEVLTLCGDRTKEYHLGGYSLAGLFALWVGTRTDLFRGIAAASPSVWFPDFTGYLRDHPVQCKSVYLSLGDKEDKTRHPVMKTVSERIRETCSIIQDQGIPCILEWNPGNHFKDPVQRTARAFSRLLDTCKPA
ncbi:MAG: esterase [Lachnospiraceae bacterium]|nr:esterase [Lachnospiraceae bacterium]